MNLKYKLSGSFFMASCIIADVNKNNDPIINNADLNT